MRTKPPVVISAPAPRPRQLTVRSRVRAGCLTDNHNRQLAVA